MTATQTEIIARAIIRRDDSILLAGQIDRSLFFLPGGHVEPGERVEAALVRELAEEFGTEATIHGFAGVVEHGYVEDGVPHHELNLVFDVVIADERPVSREPHLRFQWARVADLATMDVRPPALKAHLASDNPPSGFWCAWPDGK